MRIEVKTTISGVDFEESYRARVVDSLGGIEVPIIDLAHLKANTRASGWKKDLAELDHLP